MATGNTPLLQTLQALRNTTSQPTPVATPMPPGPKSGGGGTSPVPSRLEGRTHGQGQAAPCLGVRSALPRSHPDGAGPEARFGATAAAFTFVIPTPTTNTRRAGRDCREVRGIAGWARGRAADTCAARLKRKRLAGEPQLTQRRGRTGVEPARGGAGPGAGVAEPAQRLWRQPALWGLGVLRSSFFLFLFF